MNKENLLKVADFIEQETVNHKGEISIDGNIFNMAHWRQSPSTGPVLRDKALNCGTAACIGGWAEVLSWEEGCWDVNEWLGLDLISAKALFYPCTTNSATGLIWANISKEHAVAAIRYMVEHNTTNATKAWRETMSQGCYDE